MIGADKNPLAFLHQEFPQLKKVVIPGYEVEYSEKGNALKLFYESVKFYSFIKKEKQFIDDFLLEFFFVGKDISGQRFPIIHNIAMDIFFRLVSNNRKNGSKYLAMHQLAI